MIQRKNVKFLELYNQIFSLFFDRKYKKGKKLKSWFNVYHLVDIY